MKKGKPVEPIVVSEYGEIIRGPIDGDEGTYATEDTRLDSVVHNLCAVEGVAQSSWTDTRVISPTHKAIVCRGCKRSWVFPTSVKTFGDLRQYFSKYNGGPSDLERFIADESHFG